MHWCIMFFIISDLVLQNLSGLRLSQKNLGCWQATAAAGGAVAAAVLVEAGGKHDFLLRLVGTYDIRPPLLLLSTTTLSSSAFLPHFFFYFIISLNIILILSRVIYNKDWKTGFNQSSNIFRFYPQNITFTR